MGKIRKLLTLLCGQALGSASLCQETVGSLFQTFIGNGRAIDDASNNNCIQCAFRHEAWFDLVLN